MELYKEILAEILSKERIQICFPDLPARAEEITEQVCYKMLQEIQAIIRDDSLEDTECFMRIEEIVCLFERQGLSVGARHDFG